MSNNKISITAEFVAIMRAEKDYRNLFFVSSKGKRFYNLARSILSKERLKEIFAWRLKLSELFDLKISADNPEQIIEVGGGYTLRGFNLCLKNKNLIYLDTDLDCVVAKKKEILNEICKKENILWPENYRLLSVDVLADDLFMKVGIFLLIDKKTLVLAEGLTSYFSNIEFESFLKKMNVMLSHFTNAEFYSHESMYHPKGIVYNLLRSLLSTLTSTKKRKGFSSPDDFGEFLRKINIINFKIYVKEGFIFYSLFTKDSPGQC